ncbi:VCBS domain-containing protein [Ahrensia sp. R2A130]|uniref:VCBS domain-containing protein n=1 Tax=Ahrensia sp. R2A130 TaxID=744979 RepID=UPI0001E11293|nr:VCBS domain-containing protein [Ahrensia sp. R2A130]EFL89370.1 Ig family protein [Ahrensia sp. R2A130]
MTITVSSTGTTTYATIQTAIDAATAGDTINLSNSGSPYILTSTLNVNIGVAIVGESEGGVVINASAIDGYGVKIDADGASMASLTVQGPAAGGSGGNYGIKIQPASGLLATGRIENVSLTDVTVKGSTTTEIDVNGGNNISFTRVTADGENTGGNGFALTDTANVTLTDIETLDNNWGSVALYSANGFYDQTTGDITFAGIYTASEPVKIYAQDSSATTNLGTVDLPGSFPVNGAGIPTGFQIKFAVGSDTPASFFFETKVDADTALAAFEAGAPGTSQVAAITAPDGSFIVNSGMSLQAAIDAAQPGDTITVAAGTFAGDIVVDKALTINGANVGTEGADGARVAESIITGTITLVSDDVTIDGFEFDTVNTSIRDGATGTDSYSNITIQNNDFVGLDADGNQFIANGFGLGGSSTAVASNWTITQNNFTGLNGNDATAVTLFNIDGVTFTDNVIDHDDAGAGGRRGVNLDGTTDVTFSGNNISLGLVDPKGTQADFDAGAYGLQVSMSERGSSDISVTGNIFDGGYDGIVTLGNGDLSNLVIDNNDFTNSFFAIRPQAGTNGPAGSINGLTITNNTFDDQEALLGAVRLTGADAYTGVDISSNTFIGAGSNILLAADSIELAGPLVGSQNADRLQGGAGNDFIDGGDGDDRITLGDGNDVGLGGNGDDTIIAGMGGGNDYIDGGNNGALGDTVTYPSITAATDMVVDLRGENRSGTTINGVDVDTAFAGQDINGVGYATNLPASSTEASLLSGILPGGAADPVIGVDILKDIENATSGAGDDILIGNSGNNILDGGEGDDTLIGLEGADTLLGGDGNDTFKLGSTAINNQGNGADHIDGGDGIDTVDYSDQTDPGQAVNVDFQGIGSVTSSTGADGVSRQIDGSSNSGGFDSFDNIENIIGSAGGDTLSGDGGENRIEGGSGSDIISGRAGDDVFVGGSGNDTIDGGIGNDEVVYETGTAVDGMAVQTGATLTVNSAFGTAGGTEGTDTISQAETIRFQATGDDAFEVDASDIVIDIDANGNALVFAQNDDDNAVSELGSDDDGSGTANDFLPGTTSNIATGNVLDNDINIDDDGGSIVTDDIERVTLIEFNGTITAVAFGDIEVSVGTYGDLSISSSGGFTYTLDTAKTEALDENDSLTESFIYTVDDGSGNPRTATVSFDITGTNDAPVIAFAAGENSGSVTEQALDGDGVEDSAGTPTATGTLTVSDVDADDNTGNDNWSVQVGTGQTAGANENEVLGDYGTFVIDENGGWTYTIDQTKADQLDDLDVPTESFTVRVTDGQGGYDEQDVVITVNGSNDAPRAEDATGATDQDSTVVIAPTVVDPEGDTLGYNWDLVGTNGGTLIAGSGSNGANFGEFLFDANGEFDDLAAGEIRDTTFTYTAIDDLGARDTQTVTVTVTGTNDAPVISVDAGSTFGSGTGIVTTNLPSSTAESVALLSDGSFLAAGLSNSGNNNFALVKYDSSGEPDTNFGTGGVVITDLGGNDIGKAVDTLADGSIFVGGYRASTSRDFYVAKYDADGSPDLNYGSAGTGIASIGIVNHEDVFDIIALPDGSVLAAGRSYNGSQWDFGLAKFDPDGDPDTGFGGGDGIVTADVGASVDFGISLTVLPDGSIVVGGRTGGSPQDSGLVKFTPAGVLDTSFGTAGVVVTDTTGTGANDAIETLISLSDGSIVAVSQTGANFTLSKYDSDGNPFSGFGTGGIATSDISGNEYSKSVIELADGSLLVAGRAVGGSSNDFGIAKYDGVTGALDTSFGTGGYALVDIGSNTNDEANDLVELPDGSIIVVGKGGNSFATIKLNPDGSLATGLSGANSIAATVNEDDDADAGSGTADLAATGTLTVSDADTSDVVTAAVTAVTASTGAGTISITGTGAAQTVDSVNISNADLLALLTVDPTNVLDGTETTDQLTWNFEDEQGRFDFLDLNDSLTLTYTITVTDDATPAASDTQEVTITVTGTNDGPVANADTNSVTELGTIVTLDTGAFATQASNGATPTVTGEVIIGDSDGSTADTDADADDTIVVNGAETGTETDPTQVDAATFAVNAQTTQTNAAGEADGGRFNATVGEFAVDGTYGVLFISDDGSYRYELDNTRASTDALDTGVTVDEVFTYRITDGQGAESVSTLSVNVTGTNDAPVAGNDALGSAGFTGIVIDADGEPNDNIFTAQNIDSAFVLLADPNVQDSATEPHVSIVGTGDNTQDVFEFTVANPGTRFVFDIDFGDEAGANSTDVDLSLRVLDSNGIELGASNDSISPVDAGSADSRDPNIDLVIANAGTYFVRVYDDFGVVPAGTTYTLHITQYGATAPIGGGGAYSDEDEVATITAAELLANDTDVDAAPEALTIVALGEETQTDLATSTLSITTQQGATATLNAGTQEIAYDPTASTTVQALANDETITDSFTYIIEDDDGARSIATVEVVVQGRNDQPTIVSADTVDDGDAATNESGDNVENASFEETNASVSADGSFAIADVDTSDEVTASVTQVVVNNDGTMSTVSAGSTTGVLVANNITDAQALAMLSLLPAAAVIGGSATAGTLDWTFDSAVTGLDSSLAAFDFLDDGDVLTLTYTVQVDDGNGFSGDADNEDSTATETVTITITGSNDAPVLEADGNTTVVDGVTIGTAKLTGTVGEPGDISGIEAAGINGAAGQVSLEPAAGLVTPEMEADVQSILANPGQMSFDTSFGELTAELGGNVEQAFAVAWDILDEAYVNAAPTSVPAIDEAFVRLGIEYAEYLDNGGTAFTDVTAKYTEDNGDADSTPQRDQSLHDNLLGNLADASINARFSGTISSELKGLRDAVNVDLATRAVYSGNQGDTRLSDARDVDADSGYLTSASGTIVFTDLDADDTPAISIDNTPTNIVAVYSAGTLTPAQETALKTMIVIDPVGGEPGANNGAVGWTYSVDPGDIDFLAHGESVTLTYNVTATDDAAATANQTLTVTIAGSNDAPIVYADGDAVSVNGTEVTADLTGSVTEIVDLAASEGSVQTTDGIVIFTDVDLSDAPTVSIGDPAITYLPNDGISTLDGTQVTALTADLTLVPSGGQPGTNDGSVGWTYTIGDDDLDFLAAGEVVTVTYPVTVSDGNGGVDTQEITVTITGTNDAPTFTSLDQISAVTEDIGVMSGDLVAEDALDFTDVDFTDTHTASVDAVAAVSASATVDTSDPAYTALVGTLQNALIAVVSTADGAGGTGTVGTTFTVSNSAVQFLDQDQTVTAVYTIDITDSQNAGAVATRTVTITINGANEIVIGTGDDDFITANGSYANTPGGTAASRAGYNLGEEIDGLAGDDIIYAGGGDDDVTGGAGDDFIYGGSGDDEIELLIGDGAADVDPGAAATTIPDDTGNDFIFAGSGDDTIAAGAGNDEIDGGTGVDVVIFSGERSEYTIELDGEDILVSGPNGNDVISNVETFRFSDGMTGTVDLSTADLFGPEFSGNVPQISTSEDAGVTGVIPVAVDADGDVVTYSLATADGGALNGDVTLDLNAGTYTYTPDANFNGSDSFTITATSTGASGVPTVSTMTVGITVDPENDVPVIADFAGTITLVEGNGPTTAVATADGNDTADGGAVSYAILEGNDDGLFEIDDATGVITLTRVINDAEVGDRTLSIAVIDEDGAINGTDLVVTINNGNDNPTVSIAVQSAGATEDDAFVYTLPDGLFSDADGDTLSYSIDAAAIDAGVVIDTVTGAITWTPDNDDVGSLPVVITASDGITGSTPATATLTINVANTNDAPVAVDDTASGAEDTQITIDVLSNDTDPDMDALFITSAESADGTVGIVGGQLVFNPNPDFFGTATVTYTISDGDMTTTAQAIVTVNSTNDAPVAAIDGPFGLNENVAATLAVTANDLDADGDTLVVSSIAGLTIADVSGLKNLTAADLTELDSYLTASAGDILFDPGAGIPSGVESVFDRLDPGDTAELRVTYTVSDGEGGTDEAVATIIVNGLREQILGTPDPDLLVGTDYQDQLTGLASNDTLVGADGNDILDGGTGADTMSGGTGNDIYIVDDIGDTITEDVGAGYDVVYTSATTTLGDNVEAAIVTTGGAVDVTANDLDNIMFGNSGDNVLRGLAGNDGIAAGAGNDVIDGGTGIDAMRGGDGDDVYIVDNIADVVSESANEGIDRVESSVDYTLSTDVENLTLTGTDNLNARGNALDNTIIGNDGDNMLVGVGGNDTIQGGAGNDILGADGASTLLGGTGNDTYGVTDAATIVTELAGEGDDTVYASIDYVLGDNLEVLIMQMGATSATGNELNNQIYGTAGDDIINGGDGQDFLEGSGGNDVFVFTQGEMDLDYISASFDGNGAGLGDSIEFTGYAAGATVTQVAASAGGSVYEVDDGVNAAEQFIIQGTYILTADDYTFS